MRIGCNALKNKRFFWHIVFILKEGRWKTGACHHSNGSGTLPGGDFV
jgi:hypothetical protein